jgi:hypothetical protein
MFNRYIDKLIQLCKLINKVEDTFVVFLLLSWEQKVNDVVARNSYGVLNYVQKNNNRFCSLYQVSEKYG